MLVRIAVAILASVEVLLDPPKLEAICESFLRNAIGASEHFKGRMGLSALMQ